MVLHSQNKVIHFILTKILLFDKKTIEANKEDVKMMTYEKWNYC